VTEDQEIDRLRLLLCTVVGLVEIDPREIEEEMGVAPRFLHRLFNNFVEFKVQHLYAVLDAIGLPAVEFFDLAYPVRSAPPSPLAVRLRRRLDELTPEELAEVIERAGRPTRYPPGSTPPPRRTLRPSRLARSPETDEPRRRWRVRARPPRPRPGAVERAAPSGTAPESEDRLAGAIERILRQILIEE